MQRFRVLFANLPHDCLVSETKWNISMLYYTLVKIAVEFLGLLFFVLKT